MNAISMIETNRFSAVDLAVLSENDLNKLVVYPHGDQTAANNLFCGSRSITAMTPSERMLLATAISQRITKKELSSTSFESMAASLKANVEYGPKAILLSTATETRTVVNGPIPCPEVTYARKGMSSIAPILCAMFDGGGTGIVSTTNELHRRVYGSSHSAFTIETLRAIGIVIETAMASVLSQDDGEVLGKKKDKIQGLAWFDLLLLQLQKCPVTDYWALHQSVINYFLKGCTIGQGVMTFAPIIVRSLSGDKSHYPYKSADFFFVPREANPIAYDEFFRTTRTPPVLFVGKVPRKITWREPTDQTYENLASDTVLFQAGCPASRGIGKICEWANFCPRQDEATRDANVLMYMAGSIPSPPTGSLDTVLVDIACTTGNFALLAPHLSARAFPFNRPQVEYRLLLSAKKNVDTGDMASVVIYHHRPGAIYICVDRSELPQLRNNVLTKQNKVELVSKFTTGVLARIPSLKFLVYTSIISESLFEDHDIYRLSYGHDTKGILASKTCGPLAFRTLAGAALYKEPLTAAVWLGVVYQSQAYFLSWFCAPTSLCSPVGMLVRWDRAAQMSITDGVYSYLPKALEFEAPEEGLVSQQPAAPPPKPSPNSPPPASPAPPPAPAGPPPAPAGPPKPDVVGLSNRKAKRALHVWKKACESEEAKPSAPPISAPVAPPPVVPPVSLPAPSQAVHRNNSSAPETEFNPFATDFDLL